MMTKSSALRSAIGILALASLFFLPQAAAKGAGGNLLWEDQFDLAGAADEVHAITVDQRRVFVAGIGTNAAGNTDFLVRAYDTKTGTLFWEDQVDKSGDFDNSVAITADGERVFAAGVTVDPTGNADFLVRAYDATTGIFLWEDQVDKAGGPDEADAIVVHGGRVFAAGLSASVAGSNLGSADFLVRAYDAKAGTLLWEDQVDKAGGHDQALSVAAIGQGVFVAGISENAAGNWDVLLRAYDAKTGSLLFEDEVDTAGGSDIAQAVTVDGEQVFVIGIAENGVTATGDQNFDFLVRAYDAKTGTLLWANLFDNGGYDQGVAVTAGGGRIFAVGASANANGDLDLLVRAYAAKTGSLLWQNRVNKADGEDFAYAVATDTRRVFVAGDSGNAAGNTDLLVQTYDAATGALLWEDQVDKGQVAFTVATNRQQVFVGGTTEDVTGNNDFLIRAYDAK